MKTRTGKHGWVRRKRKGKDPGSAYFDRYPIGADLYRDGRKLGGVSSFGGYWRAGEGAWRSELLDTESKARAAVEARLGWKP